MVRCGPTIDVVERAAFSIRQLAQVYGVGRQTVSAAIRRGDLPAARFGPKRIVVLRSDFETWLRSHAIRPTAHAEDVVERRLERETAANTGSGP